MTRAFVSYAHTDATFATRLATALPGVGITPWIDREGIQGGARWSTVIQEALDASAVLILVLSPDAMASPNVEDEWQYALDEGKPVVPVLYRPTKVHFQLGRLQYVDFHGQPFAAAIAALAQGVSDAMGAHRGAEDDRTLDATGRAAHAHRPAGLPSGTVTFLFADIEGSTRLWERAPDAMRAARARHEEIVRHAVESQDGSVFKTVGDALHAVFESTDAAVRSGVAAQLALQEEPWPEDSPIRARMAIHTGAAVPRGADYFGPAVNRCARILGVARGGQVLLSLEAVEGAEDALRGKASVLDLGVHRLRDLLQPQHLFQLGYPGLEREFPPVRGLDRQPHNLPIRRSRFIGRERELRVVTERLRSNALVTLKGPGGAGKTRLALQAATEALDAFTNGVWLVGLATVEQPQLVPMTVAAALHVGEEAGRSIEESIEAYLRPKQLLLVLDNCEHLLDAVAELIDRLQRTCPNLSVFATSQEPLGVEGEFVYEVPPFGVPPLDQSRDRGETEVAEAMAYESIQLFVDRAKNARPGFELTHDNLGPVVQICATLDGLALAIELAAARTKSMAPAQIAERLDDRFRILTRGHRGAPQRQKTMRGAVDWSYDLSGPAEQVMLRRLSTFRGGWTLNAAETITVGGTINEDDVLDLISQLEDKSLIVSHMMGQPRYAMLETIRQYAKEKLEQSGEAPELETRHAAWCLDLAGEAQQGLDGSEQERWLDRLATEADNIRAALRRCAQSRHVTPGLRLAIALRGYWHLQGRFAEGRLLLGPLLDAEPRDPVEPELRATAHNAAGGLAYYQGDLAAARASFEHVVDHRRGEGGELPLARALHNLANVHRSLGAIVESRRLFEESLTLKRATGTPQDITFATRDLGVLELACSNYDTSRSLLQESLSIERASGRTVGLAETLCALAHVAVYVGDGHLARQLGEESLELCRSLGSRLREADALEILGEEALERGAHEDGLRFFEQAIDIQEDLGNELGFMRTTAGSGLAFLCLGDDRRAVAALDVALSIAEKIGDRRGMARCHLFYGAANEGTPGSSTARARSYEQALDIGQELHASWMILGALEGIAGLAAGQGRPAWALKLLSAAESQRRRLGIPRLHARDAGHAFDAHVEGCRQALADNEFEAAWDAGRNLTLDEAAQAASE